MDKETLYRNILDNLTDGVYYVEDDRKIVFWNKAAEKITGYSAEEVTGSRCQDDILAHIDKDGRPICLTGCPLCATMQDSRVRSAQVFLRHKEGYRICVQVSVFPVYEQDIPVGAIEVFSPVSAKIYDDDLVSSLAVSAMTDQLTKLPNRKYLESFLDYSIHQHDRFGNLFCILYVDIDNFSNINNTYGHATGDAVLQNISQVVSKALRKDDLFGRWGGEEFLGIFEMATDTDPLAIAEKIRSMIEASKVRCAQGETVQVTVSVGVTMVKATDTMDSIVKRADGLMYKSKQEGKNRCNIDV